MIGRPTERPPVAASAPDVGLNRSEMTLRSRGEGCKAGYHPPIRTARLTYGCSPGMGNTALCPAELVSSAEPQQDNLVCLAGLGIRAGFQVSMPGADTPNKCAPCAELVVGQLREKPRGGRAIVGPGVTSRGK
jgi:hypothetical protein